MSFVTGGVPGLNAIEWSLGDMRNFLELMMILYPFQNMSIALFNMSIEIKKGG